MEVRFKEIELSGISEETIKKYDFIFQQHFMEKIMPVSDIAKAAMHTEETVQALATAFDVSCDGIMYAAAVIQPIP